MLKQFPPPREYFSLSLKDLLEARDAYHAHLSHLSNVVGTAVGRYLIRENDWHATHPPQEPPPKGYTSPKSARTLFNSVVTDWSWPCVLVFVNQWYDRTDFKSSPDQMVPRALFLPDGRVIPTCVVFAEEEAGPPAVAENLSFPSSYVGGGYVTVTQVQGRQHVGSIGCLVTDGSLTYALTNRHVTGSAGREIYTLLRGRVKRIGVSDPLQIDCRPFTEMYNGWPGGNVELHLDAGLIRIDDLEGWTTQVLSMGPMDEVLDLTKESLTLSIIGSEVKAFGGGSGGFEGLVAALFYRYRSIGGTDYVTEFLIRPAGSAANATVHGDSGTLWFWKQAPADHQPARLRPFAVQWGGHVFVDPAGGDRRAGRFALAASLSTICRELGVSVVRDWNTGLPEYWGDVGHYTIGFFACAQLSGKVGKLMKLNQELVSYPTDSLTSRTGIKLRGPDGFVRLADVPDRVWKIPGGDAARGFNENGNHFADMDQKLPNLPHKGKTLLQLCESDSANVDPDVWSDYYTRVGDSSRGLLPFRVWQFFDEMQAAAAKGDVTRFVCAAGLVAHYVGDACQPLHISYLFNGEPMVDANGKKFKRGEGVHEAYESNMLTSHSVELLALLKIELAKPGSSEQVPTTGKKAAVAVVKLMSRAFQTIKPMDIVNAYDVKQDLWAAFKDQTVTLIADGTRTLARIWQGAWNAGSGNKIADTAIVAAKTSALMKLYENPKFVPSMRLQDIKAILK